jgi:hypothetical protein
MGNTVSTPDCFVLSQLPPQKFAELLAEDFTVIRTSGEQQSAWRIPSVSHDCHEGKHVKYHAQVWDSITDGCEGQKKWRFHMVRDVGGEAHVCGWRPCEPGNRGFWPTRLTTPEEKEAWWTELDALVATLKRTRGMSDAEWFPLLEAQREREEAECARQDQLFRQQAEMDADEDRLAAIEKRRRAARAMDPEMAARHAFWTEFEQRLAERKKTLNELKALAEKDPAAQTELERYQFQWGSDDRQIADMLHNVMLGEKKVKEQNAKLAQRNAQWTELEDQERAAVERKDYPAAQRAHSQKQTAMAVWAQEDARDA